MTFTKGSIQETVSNDETSEVGAHGDWMGRLKQLVTDGMKLSEACALVVEEMLIAHECERFVRADGARALEFLFRDECSRERSGPLRSNPRTHGKDKTDISELDTGDLLLMTPVPLGNGRYKAMGDLTKKDCHLIADRYRRQGEGILAQSRAFDQIGRSLRKGQVVKDHFDDGRLKKIFRDEKKIGK